jgi:hypothetical protein
MKCELSALSSPSHLPRLEVLPDEDAQCCENLFEFHILGSRTTARIDLTVAVWSFWSQPYFHGDLR